MERVTHELAAPEFLKELKDRMRDYVDHLHVMKWQAHQFKECLATFAAGNIVWAMDFAEELHLPREGGGAKYALEQDRPPCSSS
jgi:hypothetical protein